MTNSNFFAIITGTKTKKGLEPEMAYEFIRESLERKLKNAEKAEKMAKQILEAE